MTASMIQSALGHDVEKKHLVSGVGHLGGDTRSHDSGAEHRDLVDAHDTDSRTVAMPWPPPMHCVASA